MVDFVKRLSHLRDNNKYLFDKLWGICLRLQFVEQIKHYSEFEFSARTEGSVKYHIERLSSYLTTTCIDVAAGKKNHKDYTKWLEEIFLKEEGYSSQLKGIELAENTKMRFLEISKIFYGEYQDQHGTGRNFKRLITQAPLWAKNWIAYAYFIEKGDIADYWFERKKSRWIQSDVERRAKLVANYLYDLRNRFTHSVDDVDTLESGGTLGMYFNRINYTFISHYQDGDYSKKKELSIGLRHGLVESDVIRFVVVVEMRRWLGYNDTADFAVQYSLRNSYRNAVYDLLREIKSNYKTIQYWHTYHLFRRWGNDFPLPKLKDKAVTNYIDNFERERSVDIHQYAHEVRQLNESIERAIQIWNNGVVNGSVEMVLKSFYLPTLVHCLRESYRNLIQEIDFGFF